METTIFTNVFELLAELVWIAPIVILAVLAMVDLRAVMVVRAIEMLRQRARAGETRFSREEWEPQVR